MVVPESFKDMLSMADKIDHITFKDIVVDNPKTLEDCYIEKAQQ